MTVPLKVKANPTRNFPQDGDTGYGIEGTALIQDLVGAVNNTPALTQSVQWDAVVGTNSNTRTHASLAAVIADAAITDGMCVAVQEGTYSIATMTDITKRLFIEGVGTGCVFTATAGIANGAIIKMSKPGITLRNVVVDAGGGTPQYAVQINAVDCAVDILASGSYAVSTLNFISGLSTFGGLVRDTTGAILYGTSAGTVTTTLSNLTSPTAINQDLIPSADNTKDIGTAIKTWKKAYIGEIASTTIGATTGNITTVASTTVGATTGNITTVNSTTGNITTVASTTVGATTGNITTVNSNIENVKALNGVIVAVPIMEIVWSNGAIFTKTLAAGANTFTWSGTTSGQVIYVLVTGAASTLAWPAGIKWVGGVSPTQTASGVDLYSFINIGGTIYGSRNGAMA